MLHTKKYNFAKTILIFFIILHEKKTKKRQKEKVFWRVQSEIGTFIAQLSDCITITIKLKTFRVRMKILHTSKDFETNNLKLFIKKKV